MRVAKYLNKSDHSNLVKGVEYTLRQLHDLTGINRGSLWRNLRGGFDVTNNTLRNIKEIGVENKETAKALSLRTASKKVSGRWV